RTARQVIFYNLNGTSFSNSFQAQADFDVADWMDLRLAYRYNDVQTTYGEELLRKPLTSPHRAFANTALKFGKGWVLDYTVNWLSAARIPSTLANDEAHRLPDTSPSYFLSNTQITKSWKNGFDVYVGGENIFNYKMDNPILSADNPFGTYFDSSLIWGPIFGANFYVGVRYALK
ncbi:MAG: TonB-dependent receptor, partial [Bacteroidetes bacterium OLB11]